MNQKQLEQLHPQVPQYEDTSYVCVGTCQAVISDDDYAQGMTKCTDETCYLWGKPFVRGTQGKLTGRNIEVHK